MRHALRSWIRTGEMPSEEPETRGTGRGAQRADGLKLADAPGFENVNPDEVEEFKRMGGRMERQKPQRARRLAAAAEQERHDEVRAKAAEMKAKLGLADPVP